MLRGSLKLLLMGRHVIMQTLKMLFVDVLKCQNVLLLDFIHTFLGSYATKQTSSAHSIIDVQTICSKTIISAPTASKSEETLFLSLTKSHFNVSLVLMLAIWSLSRCADTDKSSPVWFVAGLDTDGIYRVSGNLAVIQKLRFLVNHGED